MINKLSYTPAFTSKVNVAYSPDKHYQEYYNSVSMGDQLIKLSKNGNDDIVNIYPGNRGGFCKSTTMKMQVLRKGEDGQLLSYETTFDSPSLVLDAYERALGNGKEVSCDEVVGDFLVSEPKEHYENRPRVRRHRGTVLPPLGGDGDDGYSRENYREATRIMGIPIC